VKTRHNSRLAKWPASERVPRDFNDALARGWKIRGSATRDDGGKQTVEVYIHKAVGPVRLRLTVPYQLIDRYGKPRDPRVRVKAVRP
jgi:hypothetical protein